MQQLAPTQLKAWLDDSQRPQPVVIDVREPWEFDVCRLAGAKPMPMRSVPARYLELDRHADTVIVCHHGARSYQVAMFLEYQGFTNIYNLHGGLAAWAREVDPALPTY
jgi:rhodanese-related sulfurtransferase